MATVETPLGVHLPPEVPHWPHPPQEAFLWLDVLEALYGGAAGGGKSDALLMAALQYVDTPGYAALILRKTFADLNLPGAIMDRSKTWLAGTDARWNDNEKQWKFPSGATLTFGYLQTANDKYRYQGAEFQFIGFDELTQFDEADYSYLLSRLRRPAEGHLAHVPLRMRAASNPGGRGHKWVKRRFIDRQPNPDDPEDTPAKCRQRVFVPAKLDDNPSVDQGAYTTALAGLDPQTRAQLLNGDWDARQPGNWVYDEHGIAAAEKLGRHFDQLLAAGRMHHPATGTVQVAIDWGIGSTHILPVWQLAGGGLYIPPSEIVSHRGEPSDLTRRALDLAATFDFPLDEARYDAAGAQQMQTFASIAPSSVGIYAVSFSKRKKQGIGYLRELFNRTAQGLDHRIIAISPTNTVLLEQLKNLQLDDKGDVVKVDDHGPDTLIAAVVPVAVQYPSISPEALAA